MNLSRSRSGGKVGNAGGKVDHCGTDLFNLLRVDCKWLIAGVADTGITTCSAH